MFGYVRCTAPSLQEREVEGEASCLLALRAGNQAALNAMAVAVAATKIKSVAISFTGK